MMRIPLDDIGYSVENGHIHTRYQDHAPGATRTRTAKGVLNLLGGKKGSVCSDCYPTPQYPTPAKRTAPQRRRSSPNG